MKGLGPAEQLLQDLGISDPRDIDLEAIAFDQGAVVKYQSLKGCEARIVGYGDRGIITIDPGNDPFRVRFSIGHELGHWHRHRGRSLMCRSDEIGNPRRKPQDPERVADSYAADLLMPRYLFDPLARQYDHLTVQAVRELGDLFDTSLTATAIRLIESRHSPAILICHGRQGRKWFARSPDVPERWFPQEQLDPESFASDLLFGPGDEQAHPRLIGADAWFDRPEAHRYELHEQSVRTADDEILTILRLNNADMLEDWGS